MSAIFGLIHLDGRPVSPEPLDAMRRSMAHWGPDGGGLWCEGDAGLGQLLLYNTPESLHESQPLVGAGGDLVMVAGARLDNRPELCDLLAIPHPERPSTPDGRLILLAYEQWGEECVSRLLGDWAFAVWSRGQRRLFLARDQLGHTAFYYFRGPREFVFASSIKGILSLPSVPRRPSDPCLAEYLTLVSLGCDSTLHDGIMRLWPGNCLTVAPPQVTKRQYYQLENAPAVRLASNQAYVERFLELYEQAVRRRLRSHRPVGATLSAGLDSASVTALAAREFRRRDQTLVAFTSAPYYPEARLVFPDALIDEWPLAATTASWAGNVEHVPIRAAETTPLAALERSLWAHGEPDVMASNLHWIVDLLAEARRRGLGVLLTGQTGNNGISWKGNPFSAFGLLYQGRWHEAWQALLAAKTARQASWPQAAKVQLAAPIRALLRACLVRYGLTPRPWAGYSAIHPSFALHAGVARHARADAMHLALRRVANARAERLDFLKYGAAVGGAAWHEWGAAFGLEVRDPTADLPLLEYCLGIPDEQYAGEGHDRWFIRRAMDGLLPPEVLWNRKRGIQGADFAYRLLADRAGVEAVLARLRAAPSVHAYLDLGRMQRVWTALQQRVTKVTCYQASWILMRGLSAGLFLLTFSEESGPKGDNDTHPTWPARSAD